MRARFIAAVAAMVVVVAASNILVQYPVGLHVGSVNLGDFLTWGAFTYPFAFLVNDLTNRLLGSGPTRRVVLCGFAVAVVFSFFLSTPRIAIASGTAFLLAQLMDIAVFNRLRHGAWWRAPLVGSLVASVLDTVIFFGIAFSAPFSGLDQLTGRADGSLTFPAPLLGVGPEVELWMSLASGDFLVKLVLAGLLLIPYGSVLKWALATGAKPASAS